MKRHISLRLSERKIILIIFDLIFLHAALLISIWLRKDLDLTPRLVIENFLWFIILSAIWVIVGHIFDVYDLKISSDFSHTIRRILPAALITATVFLFIPFVTPSLPSSRIQIWSYFFLLGIFPLIWRYVYIKIFSQPIFSKRAVLLTDQSEDDEAINELMIESGKNISVLGKFLIEDNANRSGKIPCLGTIEDLYNYVSTNDVSEIILSNQKALDKRTISELARCLEIGIEIIPLPMMFEMLTGKVMLKYVSEANWWLSMPLRNRSSGSIYTAVKRIVDVLFSFLGLVFLSIIFPIIAAAILLDSRGPIIYSQERVGRQGKIFKLYKFRTMYPNAESNGPVWAKPGDGRVTRVGKVLRRIHIDELPQLINILKGDMSIVGPRAERPEFVTELAKEIPFYNVRHSVRPGATGWALLKQGYADSKESSWIKLEYDLYYIKYQSLWLDMIIIFKTVIEILRFRGRA